MDIENIALMHPELHTIANNTGKDMKQVIIILSDVAKETGKAFQELARAAAELTNIIVVDMPLFESFEAEMKLSILCDRIDFTVRKDKCSRPSYDKFLPKLIGKQRRNRR